MKRTGSVAISPNALAVLKRRYLRRDPSGEVCETPAQMFRRVAENLAEAEKTYNSRADIKKTADDFYRVMVDLEFLPNSPTLMNAGRELQQLSACFVLPVEDSLRSIFEAVKNTALIHQSGGGTGFSFSHLRPKDDPVMSTSGIASGPVSFMKVFNTATEVIKQGGTRRGANMGILRIDHPDILDFIAVKENPRELTNFNLSVSVTDHFMEAALKHKPYDLIHPNTRRPVRRLAAADVFDRIVRAAWATGEPGILFLDRINRDNPTPPLGQIEATNPCGEQPLLPFESCNLGSINLTKMVRQGSAGPELDKDKLRRTIRLAVRLLDNVIDQNRYPLPEIKAMTQQGNRKIGLGVMGLADLLILQGLPYNSEQAVAFSERLMAFIQQETRQTSILLAKERGVFPNFSKSIYASHGPRLRNATTTTIAPTGTLALIAGCSSGIEPLYGIATARIAMEDLKLVEVHPLFIRAARGAGIYSKALLNRISRQGSIQREKKIPKDLRRLFVTAHDISPEYHIRMQAAFQKYTDNAVSKTVNFPEKATPDQVRRVFLLAYRSGCKGVTIYRSGSRDQQVLTCSNVQYC
ncbi:MAG TPA: adenosylcobalamin-dependent ribonucleoside-diphosphate reductase [Nitrospiria bacterium]|nr:adenosylcobalamin-dependent ribonucleoside-diphosphate reductase [Nitrospiria bacterium]